MSRRSVSICVSPGPLFAAAMQAVRTGPGMEAGVDLGPLINAAAQSEMVDLVGASTDSGSTIATGGTAPDRPGFFYLPTVLTSVGRDDPILGHEIFGPVAPVVTFEDEDEAIALSNDTEHGLASYLYSGDLSRAMRVAVVSLGALQSIPSDLYEAAGLHERSSALLQQAAAADRIYPAGNGG